MCSLNPGVYPASVTPFLENLEVDFSSLARLLALFQVQGCAGVVLAGTTGEGPSLSSYERRDLLISARKIAPDLNLILGIATSNVPEAIWLANQAAKAGARACLMMPPAYYKSATEQGIADWYLSVFDKIEIPVLVYNFPKVTGITITSQIVSLLKSHPNFAGIKDSSGELQNLKSYRESVGDEHLLFVGDETLLLKAMKCGWSGTISGAANSVSGWLVRYVQEELSDSGSPETTFNFLLPILKIIRSQSQPATHKATLFELGILSTSLVRPPLEPKCAGEQLKLMQNLLGISKDNLGLNSL